MLFPVVLEGRAPRCQKGRCENQCGTQCESSHAGRGSEPNCPHRRSCSNSAAL